MPWGKYRGQQIAAIPTSYLVWVAENCRDVSPWLMRAICEEIRSRLPDADEPEWQPRPTPAPTAGMKEIVQRWFREQAMKHHPDRGGDTKVMQAINEAHDRLKELVESAR
jgi:hypothetical protein